MLDFVKSSAVCPRKATVHPEDSLEQALHLLEHKNFSFLPVVLPPRDKVVLGILKIEDALTAYNQQLLKEKMFGLSKPESKAPGSKPA
uniref:CBS domain-containing protein n=1 Tax=Desulfobacca acetoxidans TaxID=60893 RepID=A0A7C3V496_9BACT